MLINPPFRMLTEVQRKILKTNGIDPDTYKPTILIEGVFSPSLEFNGHFDIDWRGSNLDEANYPEIGEMHTSYGVCDNYQQILNRYPELVTSDRRFCIAVSRVRKDEQGPHGGWRWHKWGPYIGTQLDTTEYLYDEPLVEEVWCFHVYEWFEGSA